MIISKPKLSTLFSLGVFLILAYGLAAYFFVQVVQAPTSSSWMVIGLGVTAGIAVAVSVKTIMGYKQLFVSKNRLEVRYAFNLLSRKYYFKELAFWKETNIKTFSGQFKELSIHFSNGKSVKLTWQENSNYEKVSAFMQRNYKRKMQ